MIVLRRPPADRVQLSEAGKSARSSEAAATDKRKDVVDADPKLQLIKTLLEFLTGRQIKVFDASELDAAAPPDAATASQPPERRSATPPQPAGYGVEYDYHEAYSETEQTTFSASGVVHTADGRDVSFEVDLAMQRSYSVETNNGAELFGPASGNGFGELAGLDSDHNGWIDENDPAFQSPRVWTKDEAGDDRLQSLAEAGVGAVALTYVNTPFELKNYADATLGQIRSSGVFCRKMARLAQSSKSI